MDLIKGAWPKIFAQALHAVCTQGPSLVKVLDPPLDSDNAIFLACIL